MTEEIQEKQKKINILFTDELLKGEKITFDTKYYEKLNNNFFKIIQSTENEVTYKFIPKIFGEDFAVNDCIRYSIRPSKEDFIIEHKEINKLSDAKKCIIFILESPHIDEYDLVENIKGVNISSDNFKPNFPAAGKSGDNIENILKFLNDINKFKENIDVILINRIQFQTSLGSFLKDNGKKVFAPIRNRIFDILWGKENIEKNFWERLTEFIEKYQEKIIINASTKDSDKGSEFHKKLEAKMAEYSLSVKHYNHPSNWGIKKIE